MRPKPKSRNWNDVQMAIATAAIVTTLGMWNVFAGPSETEAASVNGPSPTPTEPPVEASPAAMPQVKIMFTQMPSQPASVQQPENKKKKKKKDNNNNGGSASVTQTQSS